MRSRRRNEGLINIWSNRILLFLICILSLLKNCNCDIKFKGIPAAFGDLDLNKRTDIVAIGDDGKNIDVYYQFEPQPHSQTQSTFSCRSIQYPVVQVYIADIDNDGNPNLLALLLVNSGNPDKIYKIMDLKNLRPSDQNDSHFSTPKLTANPAEQKFCDFEDLNMEMTAQPLLFDLEGDLRADFMSLDINGVVTVWKAPSKEDTGQESKKFKILESDFWRKIPKKYFIGPHSNAFIDMNEDRAADIVLSAKGGEIAYLYADKDSPHHFKSLEAISLNDRNKYRYGQSALVDINADGVIDHVLPKCDDNSCMIVVVFNDSSEEIIIELKNQTLNYQLEPKTFAEHYEFPVTLRASDLDADGYTDFVVVAKENQASKSKVIYLHNTPISAQHKNGQLEPKRIKRSFEIQEINSKPDFDMKLVTLFDINEDGKVDMLIGHCEKSDVTSPQDMEVYSEMNKQMVDAYFMKVLVTNGISNGNGSNGQSARGPSIYFQLRKNDGEDMTGCAGQQSQSSYFALQQTYVILGLGQTPHFVEKLSVTIPGFVDKSVRTRVLEQIVPDAQIIIIPRDKNRPESWDYKMFLSPMSELVPPTLIALAAICVLLLIIIFILHRQETLEDAAEHEEYKRHWPESR